MKKILQEEASKKACEIIRNHYIGSEHPNISAYNDDYIIRNYPFEYQLFLDGFEFAQIKTKCKEK